MYQNKAHFGYQAVNGNFSIKKQWIPVSKIIIGRGTNAHKWPDRNFSKNMPVKNKCHFLFATREKRQDIIKVAAQTVPDHTPETRRIHYFADPVQIRAQVPQYFFSIGFLQIQVTIKSRCIAEPFNIPVSNNKIFMIVF